MPVLVNGTDIAASPHVALVNGRLFAPLRSVVVRLVDRVAVSGGVRITISRGTRSLSLRLDESKAWLNGRPLYLAAAPYRAGEAIMLPLRDIVSTLDEGLRYDSVHDIVAVTIPAPPITLTFTPAPVPAVTSANLFTPRPAKPPPSLVASPVAPRRTPIPVHLGEEVPL
jgi:hypothetical protein